jgi:hypothetical protein
MADFILILHALYILFVIGGQLLILIGWFRRWKWVRNIPFRLAHLLAIGFVVLEAWFGIVCPLTNLENYLRSDVTNSAGELLYQSSFIEYWLGNDLVYCLSTNTSKIV